MKGTAKMQSMKSYFLSNFSSIFGNAAKITNVCSNVMNRFERNVKHCGIHHAIKIDKESERYVRMMFLEQEPKLSQIWLRTGFLGYPKYLGIDPHQVNDPEYQRAVLTALGYYKLYSLSPDETMINGITEPGSQTLLPEMLQDFQNYARNFFQKHKIDSFVPSQSLPIYATTKAGASGHSAMGATSIVDAKSIYDLELLPTIIKVAEKTYIKESVKKFLDIYSESLAQFKFTFKYRPVSGRIHLLSEDGGKTRAICIPDIWTQSVLKPVHEYFMNVLKSMPHDGTFSHPALAEQVRVITTHHSLFCFDLTAATDRFPLEFQKVVLTPLLGNLIEDWAKLLVERDFHYKDRKIRYGCGQPMGMLSSWAAFSISHHVLVNYCLERSGGDPKSFYAIIGDDMVLQDGKAAGMYRQMLEILGVQISDSKSLVPKGKTNVGEIAKRYFRNGIDISPIPPKVLLESTKSVEGFIEFLEVLNNRISTSDGNSGLDWSERLVILWKHNVDHNSESAQALLTCPAFLKGLSHSIHRAPLSRFTPMWDISRVRMISNLWDRFILDETVNKLNQNQILLQELGGSSARPDPSKTVKIPLLREYLQHKLELLKTTARIYGGLYVDGEADSFEPDPIQTLTTFLTEPDPFSPKDFEEKRRIRRKRSLQLIQKFWIKNKRMLLPPILPKTE